MTFKEFCTKKEIVINNFRKNKWKTEDGSFSYPRGKRTIDALKDVIDIVFGENELKIEKEMTVRGDGVVGTILLAAVYFEENDKKLLKYITFTVTDRLFALNSFDNPTTALIADILHNDMMSEMAIAGDETVIKEADNVSNEEDAFHEDESEEVAVSYDDMEHPCAGPAAASVDPIDDYADDTAETRMELGESSTSFMPTDIDDFGEELPFI